MGTEIVEVALKFAREDAHARLAPLLADRATLVLGPSGAGKSTLVNLMVPGARAQTAEISKALKTGRHTTTVTEWHWIDRERTSALIDSPGFQEFGLRHIDPARLAALERGAIAPSRHRIYAEIFAELQPRPGAS